MSAVVLARVAAVETLSPSYVRISFAGCEGVASGGYDQRIKILLARPGQDEPVLPDAADWYGSWRSMPEAVRPTMRTFTIRAQDDDHVHIEFALHGDAGPASAWARAARPGSTLGIIGPSHSDEVKATAYEPGTADWQLLVGDDTALPAMSAIVESLPAGSRAKVFVQVPYADDVRSLDCLGEADVTWTVRDGLASAVRSAALPGGTPYAWVAGESSLVRDVRRYLVGERGWNSKAHYFGGYWKQGACEN